MGRTKRVYRVPFAPGQLRSELRAAAAIVVTDSLVGAVSYAGGLIHGSPPTALNTTFTFVAMFVWTEIWFYVTHRWMHRPRWFFMHAQHHVAKVAHPMTSLSFSVLERLSAQVGIMGMLIVSSRVLPISIHGIFAYFMFNYVANVFGHMNVELLPVSWTRSPLRFLFNSASYHSMHHARFDGHYGLFTPALDRLCGTYFADYPFVHERAASAQGLTRLTERQKKGEEPRGVLPSNDSRSEPAFMPGTASPGI